MVDSDRNHSIHFVISLFILHTLRNDNVQTLALLESTKYAQEDVEVDFLHFTRLTLNEIIAAPTQQLEFPFSDHSSNTLNIYIYQS